MKGKNMYRLNELRALVVAGVLFAALIVFAVLAQVFGHNHPTVSGGNSQSSVQVAVVNKPVDLAGVWRDDVHQFYGTVANNELTVSYTIGPDSVSLYWQGSFDSKSVTNNQVIHSIGNQADMASVLYASSDTTKDFIYRDNQIIFNYTILGQTTTIKMKRG
jgi:hypothetical protein